MSDDNPPEAGARRARKDLLVGGALIGLVVIVGMSGLFFGGASLTQLQQLIAGGWHGFAAACVAVAVFVGLSFIGVPQVLLVAAAAVGFGPWIGFLISWIGKLIACVAGFAVGRRFGAKILQRYAGPKIDRAMTMLSKGGLVACAVVRLTPTVPSIVVNLAAGATRITWWDFIIGSGLGNIPKTALIAFAGDAAAKGAQGHFVYLWIATGVGIAAWGLLAWGGRRMARAEEVLTGSADDRTSV